MMMRRFSVVAAAMFVAMIATAAQAAGICTDLAGLRVTDTRIETAEVISAKKRWDYPPSLFNFLAGPNTFVEDISFCRVTGVIERAIAFELWLPNDWNGKFQAVGNAGYSGAINYPGMGDALARGYATVSTDVGHKSKNMFEVSWMDGHNEDLINFGHRAHHLTAVRAKAILTAHYQRAPKYSYFNGCSSGGWQGLTEIQRYPDDYDGIVAGAPAHDFVRLQANALVLGQLTTNDPEGNLSPEQGQALVDAALASCDPQDGVTDGLISAPLQCDFDPKELQCSGEADGLCLSSAQVERAQFLYGLRTTDDGLRLYPGPTFGTLVGGAQLQTASDTGLVKGLDAAPDWDETSFDADQHIPELEDIYLDDMSAMNPDLRHFYSNGGKVIVYHGWNDPAISPYHTIQYRDMVARKLGAGVTNEFYRIFMVPGMGHCGGGPGPNVFDSVTALENWVEHGQAPTHMVASHMENGQVTRTRPLCVHPQTAQYNGTGDTDMAENFTCRDPGAMQMPEDN